MKRTKNNIGEGARKREGKGTTKEEEREEATRPRRIARRSGKRERERERETVKRRRRNDEDGFIYVFSRKTREYRVDRVRRRVKEEGGGSSREFYAKNSSNGFRNRGERGGNKGGE